jgi:hypothetical protein
VLSRLELARELYDGSAGAVERDDLLTELRRVSGTVSGQLHLAVVADAEVEGGGERGAVPSAFVRLALR